MAPTWAVPACFCFMEVRLTDSQDVSAGREVNLSEEELINCVPYNSGGVCNKGEVAQGFDYIRKKGLLTEEQLPFGSDRSTPHGIHCRRSWGIPKFFP